MSDGKSEFVHLRNAFTGFFSHLFGTATVQKIIAGVEAGGEQVVKAAVVSAGTAMLVSHTAGGDKAAVEQAGKDALLGSLQTVGASVGTEVVEQAIHAISSTIHAGTAEAPPTDTALQPVSTAPVSAPAV